jgi:phosphonate transport system permease protein
MDLLSGISLFSSALVESFCRNLLFADTAVYRWEYNFRASTVMGMVGAGGIGFELIGSLRIMQYREVSAILLVILAMVTLVDSFSGFLRKKFK